MDQRIVEILMYVIGEIQAHRIKLEEVEGISDELVQRGYSQRDVATAISLFMGRLQPDAKHSQIANPSTPCAHRVLHDIEKQYLTPEAQGYLIQMTHLGILDSADVEDIVERCMFMGNLNVSLEEMKMLVATCLLDKDLRQPEGSFALMQSRPWPERIH